MEQTRVRESHMAGQDDPADRFHRASLQNRNGSSNTLSTKGDKDPGEVQDDEPGEDESRVDEPRDDEPSPDDEHRDEPSPGDEQRDAPRDEEKGSQSSAAEAVGGRIQPLRGSQLQL